MRMEQTWVLSEPKGTEPVYEGVLALVQAYASAEPEELGRLMFDVRLSLGEALTNHLKHGNKMDPGKSVTVKAQVLRVCTPMGEDSHRLMIESADQGNGFDPHCLPDPLHPANLERPSGRGVMLMRHYTQVHGGTVEYLGNGERVRMTFVLCERVASS